MNTEAILRGINQLKRVLKRVEICGNPVDNESKRVGNEWETSKNLSQRSKVKGQKLK